MRFESSNGQEESNKDFIRFVIFEEESRCLRPSQCTCFRRPEFGHLGAVPSGADGLGLRVQHLLASIPLL